MQWIRHEHLAMDNPTTINNLTASRAPFLPARRWNGIAQVFSNTSPLKICTFIADSPMENGWKWWFPIVLSVYQRVSCRKFQKFLNPQSDRSTPSGCQHLRPTGLLRKSCSREKSTPSWTWRDSWRHVSGTTSSWSNRIWYCWCGMHNATWLNHCHQNWLKWGMLVFSPEFGAYHIRLF